MHPDAAVSVALRVTYTGWPAEVARAAHARSSEDRRKDVEDRARDAWPGAQARDYEVTPETGAGAYVETLRIEVPPNAGLVQDGVLALFSGAAREISRVSVSKREGPVVYTCPETLRFEETLAGTSSAASIPPPQDLSGDGWSVQAAAEREGDAIHATWNFVRSRTRFDPAAFSEAKKMWSAASRAASLSIRLGP